MEDRKVPRVLIMQRYDFSVRIGGFLSENIVVELLVESLVVLLVELLMFCRVGSGGLLLVFVLWNYVVREVIIGKNKR